jgi:O-antigen/teichoic acid export membrane protein
MIDPDIHFSKNAVWMVISRFGAQGLAVIFSILLARRLGSAGLGEYAFITAVIFVANAMTTFGTDMLLIREIAAKDDSSLLPASLAIQLILSTIFIGLVFLLGENIPHQSAESVEGLKIYSLALIPMAFFTVFTTALRGKQRMGSHASLNLTASALLVIAIFFLQGKNIVLLSFLLLTIQFILALLAGVICTEIIPGFWQGWRLTGVHFLKLLKKTAPIALMTLIGMLYQKLSLYMLSTMSSASNTGLFSAASRIVDASKIGHLAVFTVLYPAMAEASSGGRNQWMDNFKRPGLLLLSGAVALSLSLCVFAVPLVNLLYGKVFFSSVIVLQILSWTLLPYTVNSILTLVFLSIGKENSVIITLGFGLIVLAALNIWLIPLAGIVGAGWAVIAAETSQAVLFLILWIASLSTRHVKGDVKNELSHPL